MKKGLYISIVAALLIAFCASGYYLFDYFRESKQEADRYSQLANSVQEAREEETEPQTSAPETTEEAPAPTETTAPVNRTVLNEYKSALEQNPDLVGWIRLEGTKIDYPVLQTSVENRDYYLYRNFDGKDSDHGSIYAREECDIFKPSDNITIYGHNMKDGSMFAALGDYWDKEVWKNNSLIFFDNIYENHMYKIFAVFITSANVGEGFEYHEVEDCANAQEFNAFISECKRLSFYDTGITPVYGDKIICLSTCEYTLDNGRFVVAAVRID